MRKYFPEDVHGKKDIESLELKQESMSVSPIKLSSCSCLKIEYC